MRKNQHFDSLTALKGVFIMIIVFHNAFLFQPLFGAIPGMSFIRLFGGDLGNSMFFILSGFLMSIGYRERIEQGRINFEQYLFRRLQKFYLLYLITNAAALLLDIIQYGVSAINLTRITFTLLLQAGGGLVNSGPYNNPTWFLGALFVCYIIFYFVSYHAKNQTQYRCAVVFCIALGYALILNEPEIPFFYVNTGIGIMNFFVGCALAEVYPAIKSNVHTWLPWVSIAVLLISFYLMLTTGVDIICGDHKLVFTFLICPLFLYLAIADGFCAKILQLKPFVWLGKISTDIFFWHLVLYNGFRVILQAITPDAQIQEKQFLFYLLILIAWSTASAKLGKRLH